MIRDSNKKKRTLFFFLDDVDKKNKKMNNANIEKLKGKLKKTKITWI
jgi:hypothetical protein